MSIKQLGFFTLLAIFLSIVSVSKNYVLSAEVKSQGGGIKGEVDYCGSGPKARLRIYVPGRQFSLTTGNDGKFVFESIPAGTYDLGFELENQFIADKKAIIVKRSEITDLGRISICPAEEGQTNALKHPGLQVDKDKIGVCREDYQGIILVINGRAQCDRGKISQPMCNKGFADCDKDISTGCEADLMQDNENCGVCREICNLEMCVLGSC